MIRLTSLDTVPGAVQRPGFTPANHKAGIVHIGLGAFHKAHQAVYTDDALAASGGDWRIIGVSLRSPAPAEELTPQNGLYTVLERSASGTRARVIGAMAAAYCLTADRDAVLTALTAPETRIVSITVTEKGYGLDRATGGIDRTHPAIAADLANPEAPLGLAGLLVWALARRRAAGIAPFTVLCCDNLPDNGPLVRGLLVDFARHTAPDLAEFIAQDVAFPATMVDRITPARGAETAALVADLTGHDDKAAIECEAFRQWVIEDHFPTGRPTWEAGGAIFVQNVSPYEDMKLRMLNGTHSMLAYSGFLAGRKYVRDVMADPALAALVRRHLAAAAATLDPLEGVDFSQYARDLEERFRNPHLGHETYQIAMDGTEKMPQRIFAPAVIAQDRGQSLEAFAFATAAWLRYTLGETDDGQPYALRDPREAELRFDGSRADAKAVLDHVFALPGLMPEALRDCPNWRDAVQRHLAWLLDRGVAVAIQDLAVSR
ncbi:mannitol dehydrogenase family protein [Pseudoprimorskyibacter insulae]|uniref:Mannitol 2-dehydrogenase n=1 Tax=Pseudoprimorskyibacter insulae TaxID=1695997 RepID=A0A2R8B0G6_9RHOB|nr:mannitol dehydrogenase family protein [Pseudoprimorskyibacter insulae]SPF81778.1 Mannitol 2-dehydrogenase [Pseudoprimorskyibacter insulae]